MGKGKRRRGENSNNPYKDLDEAWRAEIQGEKDPQKIKDRIMKTAMNTVALKAAMALDQDLAKIKMELKTASAGYREGFKRQDLETRFMMQALRDRGIPVPSADDFTKAVKTVETLTIDADKILERGEISHAAVETLVTNFGEKLAKAIGVGSTLEISGAGGSAVIEGK
jgi:hypothetical protein